MAKKKLSQKNPVVIYQAKSGAIELRGDFGKETMWATQAQIAKVFGVQRPAVTKHLQNIFKADELDEKAVCSILEHTAEDGKKYKTTFYNLDAVISVGYRINSQQATEFRIWATKTLRSYIIDGFAINRSRIAKNHEHFLSVVEDLKKLLPTTSAIDPKMLSSSSHCLPTPGCLSMPTIENCCQKGSLLKRRSLSLQSRLQKIWRHSGRL